MRGHSHQGPGGGGQGSLAGERFIPGEGAKVWGEGRRPQNAGDNKAVKGIIKGELGVQALKAPMISPLGQVYGTS